MKYSMNGIPAAAEIGAAFTEADAPLGGQTENILRLNIEAAIKNTDGDTIARMVQEGFSEIAVASGGKVYEY